MPQLGLIVEGHVPLMSDCLKGSSILDVIRNLTCLTLSCTDSVFSLALRSILGPFPPQSHLASCVCLFCWVFCQVSLLYQPGRGPCVHSLVGHRDGPAAAQMRLRPPQCLLVKSGSPLGPLCSGSNPLGLWFLGLICDTCWPEVPVWLFLQLLDAQCPFV